VERWIRGAGQAAFVWEVGGRPVSLVVAGSPTPHGIRIGPVYTPPAARRRGYASALTAAVSQLQLDQGRRYCFLFTDLANPTSNWIYRSIGYEPVIDVNQYRFEWAGGGP
jgi:predicted GNAT family acetyltransferase